MNIIPIEKDNLRQFLHNNGVLLARPLDAVVGEDEEIVVYVEAAFVTTKEEIEWFKMNFPNETKTDRYYIVKKKDIENAD